MKPIIVVGSSNTDLVASVERLPGEGETVMGSGLQKYAGGKGANQAVAAGRCTNGLGGYIEIETG